VIEVVDEMADEGKPGAGIDAVALEALARRTLEAMHVSQDSDLSVMFVGEEEMAELHVAWMDEEGPPDVLSFPMDELQPGTATQPTPAGVLGDVVICAPVAARQAVAAGHSVEREIGILLVHGMLHLLGFDHAEPAEEKAMFELQAKLLGEFPSQV
jgi:probable rRNA maturation factor